MARINVVKIKVDVEKFRAAILALAAHFGLDKELQAQIETWENEGGSYE